MPFHACDGHHIITVEGLGNRYDGYHPLQTSLHRLHGSQCGFCTGGMLMSMYGLMEQHRCAGAALTMATVERSLDGNICRCTGYRPILEAFRAFAGDATDAMRRQCRIGDIEDVPAVCSMRRTEPPPTRHKVSATIDSRVPDDQPVWLQVRTLPDLLAALGRIAVTTDHYQLVAGHTSRGITRTSRTIRTFIDINAIAELHTIETTTEFLTIGGLVTLAEAIGTLGQTARIVPGFEYCARLAEHFERIANGPVRNVATLAGNLVYKHRHPEFASDVFVTLDSVDARLAIVDQHNGRTSVTMGAFMDMSMDKRVLYSVRLPRRDAGEFALRTYKVTIRAQNAHAYVNAGISVRIAGGGTTAANRVTAARICFGGIAPQFRHASRTEQVIVGAAVDLYTDAGLQAAMASLEDELQPDWRLPDAQPAYRKRLAQVWIGEG